MLTAKNVDRRFQSGSADHICGDRSDGEHVVRSSDWFSPPQIGFAFMQIGFDGFSQIGFGFPNRI
jgi:hypothetical protein